MQHDASCHVTVPVLPPPSGSTRWIPLPRRLRAAPRDRNPHPPFQRSLLSGSCPVVGGRRGPVVVAYYQHVTAVTARRPRAGRTLQVPRALLRAHLRLFRDRQLGRVAILSQFMKEGGTTKT